MFWLQYNDIIELKHSSRLETYFMSLNEEHTVNRGSSKFIVFLSNVMIFFRVRWNIHYIIKWLLMHSEEEILVFKWLDYIMLGGGEYVIVSLDNLHGIDTNWTLQLSRVKASNNRGRYRPVQSKSTFLC